MKETLEALYGRLNRREFVNPDPLIFLYAYDDVRDREIAGLIAACLAYGRVARILHSVGTVLSVMGASPTIYLRDASERRMGRDFANFTHRFAKGPQLTALLSGMGRVIRDFGSLNDCFRAGLDPHDKTTAPALGTFARHLVTRCASSSDPGHLMPCPEKGSACKRLHLYLRWMVRRDAVDPGGWHGISPARLLVPVDVHMFRMARKLGLTDRNQADLRAALEITDGFRKWSPEDPVRYDFSLTRLGLRKDFGDIPEAIAVLT